MNTYILSCYADYMLDHAVKWRGRYIYTDKEGKETEFSKHEIRGTTLGRYMEEIYHDPWYYELERRPRLQHGSAAFDERSIRVEIYGAKQARWVKYPCDESQMIKAPF
eukprot:GHVU01221131.1.p2 GENE.GHVU01221131.1~~GHVU01221131.1.p2  ORF type:complete len:108 (+),score=12.67 GHVU01221131.1:244-567(+)